MDSLIYVYLKGKVRTVYVRPQAEGLVFDSQSRQTYVVKTSIDSSTVNLSAAVVNARILGDDHYKRMPRVTVGVAR